jgi:hypothetical protein
MSALSRDRMQSLGARHYSMRRAGAPFAHLPRGQSELAGVATSASAGIYWSAGVAGAHTTRRTVETAR